MNNPVVKQVFAVLISCLILFVAYYGNLLPLVKSQTFISSMQNMRSVSTVAGIKEIFAKSFDLPSPIGQEELVRNSGNTILGVIQQTDKPDIIADLMNFMNTYYQPIIERGRGMSFEQNLYIMGTLNELSFVKTRDPKYFTAAKAYYAEGLALGPKRPQFLYGMFDIYRIEGNIDAARTIGEQVLAQWPNDDRIRTALQELNAKPLTNDTQSGKVQK